MTTTPRRPIFLLCSDLLIFSHLTVRDVSRPENPSVYEERDPTEDQEAYPEEHQWKRQQREITLSPSAVYSDPESDPHKGVSCVETPLVPIEVLHRDDA